MDKPRDILLCVHVERQLTGGRLQVQECVNAVVCRLGCLLHSMCCTPCNEMPCA